jgi:Xaa-Pro aminopeptidase
MLRVRDFMTEGYSWHVLSGESGGMVGLLDSPASGEGTSAAFPCGAGRRRFQAHEPVMVDFGTVLNGYHMDETRMFAVGSLPEEALDACMAAMEIRDVVLAAIRPGATPDGLFRISLDRAGALGYQDQFLGPPGNKVTFIGHGIGLELVEPPIVAKGRMDPLKAGTVLAIEPKLVFPDRFTAGIEDVVLVTETGCRTITRIPSEVFIC